MAVVTASRTLRDSANGNPTGIMAPVGERCSVLDQSPAPPAAPLWFQIRLDNQPNKPVGWITAAAVNATADTTVGPLDKNVFADRCVLFEEILGGSSLYLMAVAELRTDVTVPSSPTASDPTTLHGPFALSNRLGFRVMRAWLNFTYNASDIDNWPAQIDVFGGMTQIAQTNITAARSEIPTFVGLYLTQILGASLANAMLNDPTQKVNSLIAAANPSDLRKEGVDKASVLTRYNSLLGPDIAAAITSSLANSMQKAINSVQPFIAQAGGMVTNSSNAPILAPGTIAKINLLSPRIPASRRGFATRIAQKFQEAGFGPNQQIAALAAAIHKSRLDEKSDVSDPDQQGHPGRAYGLFQCRIPGVGSGHDPNVLKTADGNISTMIDYIKSPANRSARDEFAKAGDPQSAIQVFIAKFERPGDIPGEVADCIKIARSIML